MERIGLSLVQSNSLVLHRENGNLGLKDRGLLERTLYLDESAIRVTLHPTCRYLQNLIEHDVDLCYLENENIQEAGGHIMRIKIHCESKYHQMSKAYENFDTHVENIGIKCECTEGCSRCCYDLFCVSENEFLYILAAIIQDGNIHRLANIYRKAKRQEEFIKENEPYLSSLIDCRFTAQSKEFYNLGESYVLPEVCPFLNDQGRCLNYPARPNICRLYGITKACDLLGGFDEAGVEQALLRNGILKNQNDVYVKQYKPIFYFASHMLRPARIRETLKMVRNFVSLPEEEYFAKVAEKDWYSYIGMQADGETGKR